MGMWVTSPANSDMKKLTGAEIIIHEDDAERLTQHPRTLAMFRAKRLPRQILR